MRIYYETTRERRDNLFEWIHIHKEFRSQKTPLLTWNTHPLTWHELCWQFFLYRPSSLPVPVSFLKQKTNFIFKFWKNIFFSKNSRQKSICDHRTPFTTVHSDITRQNSFIITKINHSNIKWANFIPISLALALFSIKQRKRGHAFQNQLQIH